MQILRFPDYNNLSEYTASLVAGAIQKNPKLVLCMASGHTPALTCEKLVRILKTENIDYASITFFGLDEWVGLSPENEGSCTYFFMEKLIRPLALSAQQYHLFDALSNNLEAECLKMDQRIEAAGGIDLMLVGIGLNGHIGFNEPGISTALHCHVAELEAITIATGQKYFQENTTLSRGITIGLGHLQKAKQVLLLANGTKKAGVIQQTVEGPVTENFPASILQTLSNGWVLVDEEAAALLKP